MTDLLREPVKSTLTKEFESLGQFHLTDKKTGHLFERVDYYFDPTKKYIIGYDTRTDSPIFRLNFKDKILIKYPLFNGVDSSLLLQSDAGATIDAYQGYGIASHLYGILVRKGYIIISDNQHFEPATELWKKLAKNAGQYYYIVLADTDYGVYLNSESPPGPKLYDGQSIMADFEHIWTTGQDYDGYHRVLVMFETKYLTKLNRRK